MNVAAYQWRAVFHGASFSPFPNFYFYFRNQHLTHLNIGTSSTRLHARLTGESHFDLPARQEMGWICIQTVDRPRRVALEPKTHKNRRAFMGVLRHALSGLFRFYLHAWTALFALAAQMRSHIFIRPIEPIQGGIAESSPIYQILWASWHSFDQSFSYQNYW